MRARARPCALTRPSRSSASSARSKSRACANAAAGGASSQRSVCGSLTPQFASSSASGARSASTISGGVCAGERCVLAFGPQSITHACFEAAGAAAALIGRGARNAHRLQSAHAGRRIEARATRKPGVDDDAHAFDREARLGDIRGEDDLAFARSGRTDRRVLIIAREFAVERRNAYALRQSRLVERSLYAPDLALSRQKRENVAFVIFQRPANGAGGVAAQCRSPRRAGRRASDFRRALHASESRRRRRVLRAATIGASPSSFATAAPSSVADITSSFRSSRSAPCASRHRARPRSAFRLRS